MGKRIKTECAGGIGGAATRILSGLGARVVIADVNVSGAEELVRELADLPGEVSFCRTDILVEGEIRAMIDFAVDRHGGLDILINNAGVPRTIAPDAEVVNLTLEMWDKTLAAYLTSTMLGCKYAIPHMIERGGGAIVNTSSLAAVSAAVDLVGYSVAKAGVNALTREVAATYGRNNIRCNAVMPGTVLTERARKTLSPDSAEEMAREAVLTRLAEPADIANILVYLASDASAIITGQTISADAGLGIKLPYWVSKMRERMGQAFDESTFKLENFSSR